MIARIRRAFPVLGLAVPLALAGASCQKVPLLAPTGSTITLTASATTLPVNGTTTLVAQVVEAAGTVPHSGTRVTFTTTLGTIQPDAANTDVNGQARVTFDAGTASGTATITATSGGVGGTTTAGTGTTASSSSNTVKIAIGAAAVGRVGVTASPATVPAAGGDSTITANVLDTNGSPLAAVAVSFSTTTGDLSSALVTTDANGVAKTILHTATQAVVTASVGAAASGGGTGTGTGGSTSGTSSGTVTVGVAGAPTIIITPPSAGVTAGLPASFTFAITAASTNGAAIKDVTVNWGDGNSQDLGAISGSTPVTHTYRAVGSYSISAVVTDANGNTVSVSIPVTVNPPALTLAIAVTTSSPSANLPVSFTFTPTVPSGDAIRDVSVSWGDGSSQDLGAITGSQSVAHVFATADSYTVSGTVTDIGGNSASASTVVVVLPQSPIVGITFTSSLVLPNNTFTFTAVVTPTGTAIALYQWDFGDGTQTTTTTPVTTHIYTAGSGVKTVRLTVTTPTGQSGTGTTTVTP